METKERIETTESIGEEAPPEQLSLASEFLLFLQENKKWWLLPIVIMVLLLGGLMLLSSTPAAPFIYSLF